MNHPESQLQQQCVKWFRSQYRQYAMLLTHPINEGSKNTRITGAIHKAEGTVAGVPDLLLFMPAVMPNDNPKQKLIIFYGLGIEFKTPKGSQSQAQKDFQKMFEAAGYKYVIVRSFDEFRETINSWIAAVTEARRREIAGTHVEIVREQEEKEKAYFNKIIGKSK